MNNLFFTAITLTSLLSFFSFDSTQEVSTPGQKASTEQIAKNTNHNSTQKASGQKLPEEPKAEFPVSYQESSRQEVDGWEDTFQEDYPEVELGDEYNAADAGCSWGALTIQLMRSGMDTTIDGQPMQMDNLINSLRSRDISQTAYVIDYVDLSKENSSQYFPKDWVVENKINPNLPQAIDSSDSNSLRGVSLEDRRAALDWGKNQGYKMILLYEGEFGHYLAYINPDTVGDTGGFNEPGATSELVDDLELDNGSEGVYSLMSMSHITYLDIYKK